MSRRRRPRERLEPELILRQRRDDGRHTVLPLRFLVPKERAEFLARATSELAPYGGADEQLQIGADARCDHCGPLGWTLREFGRILHKHDCPHRTDLLCQAHPRGCDAGGDQRGLRAVNAPLTDRQHSWGG